MILPLLVVAVIPFSLIGVFVAFFLHSIPMSFMGIIGCIGLAGVVVNDSLVMVDFIRSETNPIRDSKDGAWSERIVQGAKLRFRPIILTTLTTVAGLLPTVYGIGGNAKSLVPVVLAMAYGLLFSTVLTLVLIPCLYHIVFDFKKKK